MAVDGIGKRNVVTEGESELSGKFIVEQTVVDGKQRRRLFFQNNPFVIQSEVVLEEREEGDFVVDASYAAFDYHKTSKS
jgi:hypothetical protein